MTNQSETSAQDEILKLLKPFPVDLMKIYPRSFRSLKGITYGMIRTGKGRRLVAVGEREAILREPFSGDLLSGSPALKLCELNSENTRCLMTLFPFTRPVSLKEDRTTFGAGDRLGTATPGHLRAIRKYRIRPVLAQQSVRENTQTGRTFPEVVRDAAWSVFQEGFEEGYGADGDHLKSLEEVKNALAAGVSMVTLDLSERLDLRSFEGPGELVEREFGVAIDPEDARILFHLFLDKAFSFRGSGGPFSIRFDEDTVKRNTLLFHRAIDFSEEVYRFLYSYGGNRLSVDFEISIDETTFPTSPESHLFFVIQLAHRGVRLHSLAPRFIGDFQKGIDYKGDLSDFRTQFDRHAAIARDNGNYKISIHSGSDKFSVFPIMGELAKDGLHVKTAGTSWLEAVRLAAMVAPPLYREMHRFALTVFNEATKHYHVTTDLDRIPPLESLSDGDLPGLFEQPDSRQLIHLTYGYLLNARGKDGRPLFKDGLDDLLTRYEEDYWSLLEKHFEKHLDSLGVERKQHLKI